jgi:hypothetical protein
VTGAPPGLVRDSLALVTLYDSTDGANWTNNNNWLSGPVSTWYGITVSGNRVTKIDLDQNNLSGSLPAEIGDLTALTHLLIRINNVTGVLPPEIGNLTNLIELDLYQNQLSDSLPSEIGNLISLVTMDISDNDFCGSLPKEIGNLVELVTLDARNNQFTGSVPSEIGNLDQLNYLHLYHNQFSGSIPLTIGSCSNLKNIYLYENQLSGSVPDEISNLTNLEKLYLYSNYLGDLPNLSSITTLAVLKIQNNQFTFEDIEPNIGVPTFDYSPQDSVGEKQDTTVAEGESLALSAEVGGSANQYQWFKNDTEISGADSSVYFIESVTFSDSGTYTCSITNTIATDLTLYHRPIHVHVTPGTGVMDHDGGIPAEFALLQNYPNPFNPETKIRFDVKEPCRVILKVYNLQGKEVSVLIDDHYHAGQYEVQFDGGHLPSGLYFYQIQMGNYKTVRKMILLE